MRDNYRGVKISSVKAASILVERVGVPQHPEPLPRSQRQTMPEDPADPARSLRRNDAWEAGATRIPTPHDNWRRGNQKRNAPKGLVAPPSTPETYGVPDTKGRTQAARVAREKADEDYLGDAGDAGYTILGIGIHGLSAIDSMHDPNLTSFPSTSSVSRTSSVQRSIQFPEEVQRCAVCNATLCFDLLTSWATTCKQCNRIACMIERAATPPQTAVPTKNREPTTSPCCRYCMRRFEDEARRCNNCTGIMCHSCNPSEAWLYKSCRELTEPQDADQIACAHCQKVRIQCNRPYRQCRQYVCEKCEHDPCYIWGKCREDEQYERRCWTMTGAASSSKDTSAIREKYEAVKSQQKRQRAQQKLRTPMSK